MNNFDKKFLVFETVTILLICLAGLVFCIKWIMEAF